MSYRFFGSLVNTDVVLSEDDIFHLTKVLRVKKGENIEIIVENNLYMCTVSNLNPFSFKVDEVKVIPKAPLPRITLGYALPKGSDKLELVLQKAVEIGVNDIILLDTSRSIGKIPAAKKEHKLNRYKKIMESAAKQAKRNFIPALSGPISLNKVLTLDYDTKILAHEKGAAPFKEVLKGNLGENLLVLVGPEGGFSAEEVNNASSNHFKIITFGANILRSETAAIYALSVISHYQEEKA